MKGLLRASAFILVLGAVFAGSSAPMVQAGPFDWLSPDWWRPQPTTVYAPVVGSGVTTVYTPVTTSRPVTTTVTSVVPASTVVYSPVTQTCYYAPETRYRWVYGRMPVTTYRPVNIVDPLTGAVTSTYQPQTRLTLLPWLHREPYTTYRLVCSPTAPVAVTETSYVIGDPCAPLGEVLEPSVGLPGTSCPPGCVPAPGTGPLPSPTEAPVNGGYAEPRTFKEGSRYGAGDSSAYSVQRPAENGTTVVPNGAAGGQNGGSSWLPPPPSGQQQIIQPSGKSAEWNPPAASLRLAQQVAFESKGSPSVPMNHSWSSPGVTGPPVRHSSDGWRPARP